MPKKIIKGYKVTNSDYTCRSQKYEVGKEYNLKETIGLCVKGFHFCLIPADCFNYYSFNSDNKVFEIEAWGEVSHGDDKSVTNNIKLIRELAWEEVLKICNQGKNNIGLRNTGDRNTGYSNTGDWNTGDRNTGNSNTGYSNTGNSNTGDRNTGNSNTGDWNTGNSNTGDWNTGNSNTGNSNTGDWNTGDRNTGYRNTGNRNTGNSNTGNRNTGNSNTGNWNTGDWNTGDRNTGYSNTGNRNTGAFCTEDAPFPMFNKPCNWAEKDFLDSKAYSLLCANVDTKMWIDENVMSDEEKVKYPAFKTTGGYIKDIPFKEAFQNAWHNWNAANRRAFTTLPNFDSTVFLEITGVDINA